MFNKENIFYGDINEFELLYQQCPYCINAAWYNNPVTGIKEVVYVVKKNFLNQYLDTDIMKCLEYVNQGIEKEIGDKRAKLAKGKEERKGGDKKPNKICK